MSQPSADWAAASRAAIMGGPPKAGSRDEMTCSIFIQCRSSRNVFHAGVRPGGQGMVILTNDSIFSCKRGPRDPSRDPSRDLSA